MVKDLCDSMEDAEGYFRKGGRFTGCFESGREPSDAMSRPAETYCIIGRINRSTGIVEITKRDAEYRVRGRKLFGG